ncbi:Hypothetical protein I595_3235 [Croceitalea dokdonensis DOKDO 023]|uniref:Uncharacterized protein n=1 Tax=Croceitalea dokdonensis DOKDO 023 TaxID=1300341 RepID=A0A0P7A2M8_9FLAO|nr:hypothetical protein [Croceitalea dokdonensis]KPM30738.1 Hypothetical protein I595_3235 [Croceitalea dokdonensis DOKDO 023]
MIVFLSILSGLVVLNVLLLIFSVNGVKAKNEKPVQHLSPNAVPKLFAQDFKNGEFKKAV